MRRRSLGPFPKTARLHELAPDADLAVDAIVARLIELTTDEKAIRAATFLVALPVATRAADPVEELRRVYGIRFGIDPIAAARAFTGVDHPAGRSLEATLCEHLAAQEETLVRSDSWHPWRQVDGPQFCNLANRFYSHLNAELLGEQGLRGEAVERFAREMAVITRSFSARFFNACARDATPDKGAIRWFLGHCLGKLELEFERERSDCVEPLGNPWRRKRERPPSLDL